MKFRPLHDRILIRRIAAEDKTKGGIIIPDTAKEKPVECEVIAIGPGKRSDDGVFIPMDVKKGDRVLIGKWSGSDVTLDGEELVIIAASDVLGIIEDAKAVKRAA